MTFSIHAHPASWLSLMLLVMLSLNGIAAQDNGTNATNATNETEDEEPDSVAEMAGLIYFKTFHNTYLTAEPDGSVVNTRTDPKEWEKFRVIKNHDGTVSFLSYFGKFLTAEKDGSVKCDRHHIDDWEKWQYVFYSETGNHTVESFHGKFLSAKQDGTVRADFDESSPWRSPDANGLPWPFGSDGGWESFQLYNDKERLVALKTYHNKYVIAKDDDAGTMGAYSDAKDTWEHFRLIANEDGTETLQSFHGKYVTFEPNGHVRANGKHLDSWEKFTFIDNGDGTVKLKNVHHKYLSAKKDGSLRADFHEHSGWSSDGGWESFTIEKKYLALGPDMRNVGEALERSLQGGQTIKLAVLAGIGSLAVGMSVMGLLRRGRSRRSQEEGAAPLRLAGGDDEAETESDGGRA